jgi:hypothetical protein
MRGAPSEAALLNFVSQYLQTLSDEQLESLPASSRPVAITQGDDLAALNLQIARDELTFRGEPHVAQLLRQMASVLSEATNRLGHFSLEAQMLRPPR